MLHIFFSWLPFTIGQVYSQVWCRPYLLAHVGFFDLRMFPWLPSKVQVVYFTPSHSKFMYVPSATCAILVIWCVSFSSPVIHRNTDKARVQQIKDESTVLLTITSDTPFCPRCCEANCSSMVPIHHTRAISCSWCPLVSFWSDTWC